MTPLLNPASFDSTVWSRSSLLVHVTFWPTFTVSFAGVKSSPSMVTSRPLFLSAATSAPSNRQKAKTVRGRMRGSYHSSPRLYVRERGREGGLARSVFGREAGRGAAGRGPRPAGDALPRIRSRIFVGSWNWSTHGNLA